MSEELHTFSGWMIGKRNWNFFFTFDETSQQIILEMKYKKDMKERSVIRKFKPKELFKWLKQRG